VEGLGFNSEKANNLEQQSETIKTFDNEIVHQATIEEEFINCEFTEDLKLDQTEANLVEVKSTVQQSAVENLGVIPEETALHENLGVLPEEKALQTWLEAEYARYSAEDAAETEADSKSTYDTDTESTTPTIVTDEEFSSDDEDTRESVLGTDEGCTSDEEVTSEPEKFKVNISEGTQIKMEEYKMINNYFKLTRVPGDGKCLFHAISIATGRSIEDLMDGRVDAGYGNINDLVRLPYKFAVLSDGIFHVLGEGPLIALNLEDTHYDLLEPIEGDSLTSFELSVVAPKLLGGGKQVVKILAEKLGQLGLNLSGSFIDSNNPNFRKRLLGPLAKEMQLDLPGKLHLLQKGVHEQCNNPHLSDFLDVYRATKFDCIQIIKNKTTDSDWII
jgi:hypothetical protein